MRRRTESVIEAVELEADGAIHRQPVLADHALGHSGKDPRRTRVVCPGRAFERQRAVEPLGSHPDTDEPLRRQAAVSPQPTGLTRRRVKVLAGCASPGAGSPPASTNLDRVWPFRIDRRHPVEAVAAEIHDAATVLQVASKAFEHPRRPVFGVAARDHHAIPAKELETLVMEVLVGHRVHRKALLVEPVDEVKVGGELMGTANERQVILRTHVHDRPEARRVAAAHAVAVLVVETKERHVDREAILGLVVVGEFEVRHGDGIPFGGMLVGVSQVGKGRRRNAIDE